MEHESETKTFLVLKYGSLENAFDVLNEHDSYNDIDFFTLKERRVILDWYYNYVEEQHV